METIEFIHQNEEDANKKVALAMFITFIIFTVVFILNCLGIFIITQWVMNLAYAVSGVLLLSPLLLNKLVGATNRVLKYIYVFFSAMFIFIIATLMTYHANVVYAYPIAIAGLYFSRKVTNYSIVVTTIVTIIAQFLGYKYQLLIDLNWHNVYELILFSVVPKTFSLMAFAALLRSLTSRTSYLLKVQQENIEDYLSLSNDMISGFATLVENRDKNTGMHIKRTSLYVELLARTLQYKEKYKDIIDDEFVENLVKAAPMHDVGKISVPDAILQKTGPLTPDEFAIMKTHAYKGGLIIHETFAHVGNENYRQMAHDVVLYHHEKWNGKGYPEGKKGEEIPLSARIMSVADVFDAISQNRCYRDAMPLEKCFKIMEEGRGVDFDPELVDAFMEAREKVEYICMEFRDI